MYGGRVETIGLRHLRCDALRRLNPPATRIIKLSHLTFWNDPLDATIQLAAKVFFNFFGGSTSLGFARGDCRRCRIVESDQIWDGGFATRVLDQTSVLKLGAACSPQTETGERTVHCNFANVMYFIPDKFKNPVCLVAFVTLGH